MVDVDTAAPPGAAGPAPTAGDGTRSRGVVVATALALLLVVLLVVGAVLLGREQAAEAEPAQRQAALNQARAVAAKIVAMGGDNAETQLQSLLGDTTGELHEHFVRTAGRSATALQNKQVTSSGKVTAAGLEKFEPGAATALVVLGGTLANVDDPQGKQVSYRLSLQLREEGGRWLVSAAEVLP